MTSRQKALEVAAGPAGAADTGGGAPPGSEGAAAEGGRGAELAPDEPGEREPLGGAPPGSEGAAARPTTEYLPLGTWAPRIGQAALETMSDLGAGASETGSELAERATGIAEVLTENGHSAEGVAIALGGD